MDVDYFQTHQPPPAPALNLPSRRAMALNIAHDSRRILLAVMAALVVTTGIYFAVPPRYSAQASLLVMLGSEYGYRADAGSNVASPMMLQTETILKSETDILTSPTLERSVIKSIGVARLYPKYLEKPSLFKQFTTFVKDSIADIKAQFGVTTKKLPAPTLDDLALSDFSRALSAVADRDGNVIRVSFWHHDPEVAAEVVNKLISLYLQRRADLYKDIQSVAIENRVNVLGEQLNAASQAYADFKAKAGISDYAMQRTILLTQQGEISKDMQLADSAAAEDRKRLTALDGELSHTPPDIVMYSESRKLQYGGDRGPAGAYGGVGGSANAPSTVRRGRSDIYDKLQLQRSSVAVDLQAAEGRRQADGQHLATIAASIKALESSEVQLEQLDLQRQLLDQSYSGAMAELQKRLLQENVKAQEVASVRVIQPAEVPLQQTTLRLLILAGGLVVTVMIGVTVAVLSSLFRRGFISAEALERSLGLPVLISIPDIAARAGLEKGSAP